MKASEEAVKDYEAFIQAHQAGFLDAWKLSHKNWKSKAGNSELNKEWKKAFYKRFGKPIENEIKKGEKLL